MKKAIAIFLLFVLAYNMAGFVVIFRILQSKLKAEIQANLKQHIDEHDITVLTLVPENQANFSSIDGKELCYNGGMFDIISYNKQTKANCTFYCISDEKENSLIERMDDEIVKRMSPFHHDSAKQLLKLLIGVYIIPFIKICIYQPAGKMLFSSAYISFQQSPCLGLHSPPPKMA